MKKRVFAALLAVLLFTTISVSSFAENENTDNETTEKDAVVENLLGVENFSTGTQDKAIEAEVDVDADIHDEVQATIPETMEEIRISSPEDFMAMVNNCSLDTWSANKKIVLMQDISLVGKDFKGIPSFDGIFDGQGHTVSEVNLKSGLSYVGFFTHVGKDAVIMNLNVSGSVMPTGNTTIVGGFCGENNGIISGCSYKGVVSGKDYIGGITGINQLTGDIRFCTCEGFVSGTHFVGGIAGKNDGNIANCRNEALVNTTNTDTEITIDSMEKLNTVLNLIRNGLNKSDEEANADVTVTDIGGIAGVSIGIITRCINNGEVGYEHVGYNIGGIAGRQSGYLANCSNNGRIKGRKDVGGIVGQAEPYITIDFATDVGYQLQQAVAKLHDSVSATLNDTKNQSDVVSARLAIIQKFTGQAVEDTRFLAGETVDFANGVSSATSEAFSRVEYVMAEASKDGGALDNTNSALSSAQKSGKDIRSAINDLNIETYLKDGSDEKIQYTNSKTVLNAAATQYENRVSESHRTYYNLEMVSLRGAGSDLVYVDSSGNVVSETGWSAGDIKTGAGADTPGSWKHSTDGVVFPVTDSSDSRKTADQGLQTNVETAATSDCDTYAKANYESPIPPYNKGINPTTGSYYYDEEVGSAYAVISKVYINHIGEMSDSTRKDAQSALNNLDSSVGSLGEAGKQTKNIIKDVAGRGSITFPQFSAEYKQHTTSLADNLAAMNDNFGLLNSEVNNATGVLVNDLQGVNDDFNNILNLYTDALDGVLEKDYTNMFSDDSLKEAQFTTDATIDSCFNFGVCEGDIDISGIAGTMAIEYDFDKESDVTGLKDSGINSSYLTRCVLRDNRNYGDVISQKNYAGGVCGRQDMGTILNCGSYSKVESTTAGYVGGVSGSSIGYIVESYAKGELSGDSYVGGVVGDGKNIKDCLTIVSIDGDPDWSGAIAGHISENGEVRSNFFVSDNLSGIDRVSYSKKAEPISYDAVQNNTVFRIIEEETEDKEKKEEKKAKVISLSTGNDNGEQAEEVYRELPYEFSNLNVNFVLEDEDLEGGKEKVGRLIMKYGDSLTEKDYPGVRKKEGFYPVWDITEVDKLTTDLTITATYKRYRTTLSEENVSDSLYQSELLVDGQFKDDDKLIVDKTVYVTDDSVSAHLDNFETMKVTVPDDGQTSHQIRFKAINNYAELANVFGGFLNTEPVLYLVEGDTRTALQKTGTMGEYSTYNVDGNDFTLSVSIEGAKNAAITVIIIAAIALLSLIIILIVIVNVIKRHGGKVPKIFNGLVIKVSERIENKEQLFYDDSKDELKPEENGEENKNEENTNEEENKDADNKETSEDKKED